VPEVQRKSSVVGALEFNVIAREAKEDSLVVSTPRVWVD
jgi:hypothetical protein